MIHSRHDNNQASPEGMTESGFSRPYGTWFSPLALPAINRWATVKRPYGTISRFTGNL